MLLSGCGRYDGTDVQEAVLCGMFLDRVGAKVVALAPARSQLHVVDHTSGDEMSAEPRDMLVESARMLRDKIHEVPGFPLETLQGLVVPGGFGGAKNLMTAFARMGERREARPEAEAVVRHFLEQKKPVGVVGMGDILVRHLSGEGLQDLPEEEPQRPLQVDRVRRIVTTPGFKSWQRASEVAAGIEAMVDQMVRWIEAP
jgi:enhancing lycopene biosynthesis protein 2